MFYSHEGKSPTLLFTPLTRSLRAPNAFLYSPSLSLQCARADTSSHLVLTSRKYGVATVWLVATLGSKSTLKRVSRKAILDVDVQKACETIVEPEAPMALRLQSNLL